MARWHDAMISCRLMRCLLGLLCLAAAPSTYATESVDSVRLYALDCGRAEVADMRDFSDTGEYDGKHGVVAVPCFLIRHPKGTLLWDTGLGDKLLAKESEADNGNIRMRVSVTLVDQLKLLGLVPADVTYVAFSHFHFDHTGNANLFGASTWIINKVELAWALGTPTPPAVDLDSFGAYKSAKTRMIDGDVDVFGDSRVRILKTPSHTPGHQVLVIRLKRSGTVILSGDLYHLRENRRYRRVPIYNWDRAQTLASFDRIEKIINNTRARIVIQHDPSDFGSLQRLPAYLD